MLKSPGWTRICLQLHVGPSLYITPPAHWCGGPAPLLDRKGTKETEALPASTYVESTSLALSAHPLACLWTDHIPQFPVSIPSVCPRSPAASNPLPSSTETLCVFSRYRVVTELLFIIRELPDNLDVQSGKDLMLLKLMPWRKTNWHMIH